MKRNLLVSIVLVFVVMGVSWVLAQDTNADIEAKIEYVMSAGPEVISQDATILDWAFDDEGNFIVLREGTNGWTCLPFGGAAACLDEVFMEWLYALINGEDLTVTRPGFSYHLLGGEALSNADPAAAEPAEDHWLSSAPYMMVLLPADVDLSAFSTDPNDPLFVMFPDTPYQHIMVPIGNLEDEMSTGM